MNITDLKQIKNIILDSLKGFREDLKKDFVTKDDIKSLEDNIDKKLKNFATKDDLKNELKNFATKKDLKLGLDDLLAEIIEVVDKNKAEKSDVEALERRMDEVEKAVQIH